MDDDFDSDAFNESDFSDDEGEDMTVTGDTTNQNQTHKVTKGQKHLEELKSSLGLTEFQNKAELKREKRRRQKARRKLKKTEAIHEAQIQTKATKLKEKAAKIVPEVVTYLDPKKRSKKEKNEGSQMAKNVKKSAENSDDESEITMKQARFDVFKFGIRGLDKDGQQEARVALALRLGAKPDKKSCLPYAQYKDKIKQEKSDLQTRKEIEKLTGMRKASTRPVSTKKKKGASNEQNPAKKKKKHNEATPLRFGKFDGGTVRLSKKELSNIKGKK